ncbi:MAG TPA: hypothetical protein VGN95_20700 [Pyrinomonadaceae bacterium]|nr:hypothetical protein [Pyrinomonadaceae bacterium]
MKLSDRYDGSNDPFEGDRTLLLKTIPVGARITRASATITPVDATRGINPFAETISFNRAIGSWGATKTLVTNRWVEVDFHARRTLSSVTGSLLTDTTLQVDIGGAFVEINVNGGIRTPTDSGLFKLPGDSFALPSLTVTKIKLTNPETLPAAITTPDIAQLTIRSTPTNASLRIGDFPALWTRPGELVRPEPTPDMTLALQASLASAKTENGFYLIPVVLHSDTIARLTVLFEIECLIEQSLLPASLAEVTLPFDFSGLPVARSNLLQLTVPPNSRLSPSGTAARVTGTFENTRLVNETNTTATASDTVEVSPTQSQAQPVRLSTETLVTDVDLMLGVERSVRLQLDLREDFDGKPDSSSLLSAPIEFELSGPAGQVETNKIESEPKWVSVHLPAEFKFKAQTAYWLVLQSIEDKVGWFVAPAPGATLKLQSTNDGGLSWRATAGRQETDSLNAFFRLRRLPQRFEMPIELKVGEGAAAVRVSLERFQALGRVDFTLDASDLAGAVNKYLDESAPPSCPEIEHVSNGDLEQWLRVGDSLLQPFKIPLKPVPRSLAIAPDGAWGYIGSSSGDAGVLQVFDVACNVLRGDEIPLLIIPGILLISSDGLHAYVCSTARIQIIDTSTNQPLGGPFEPGAGFVNERAGNIEAVTLSPDGGRLYIIQSFSNSTDTTQVSRKLYVLDTAKLLQAGASNQPNMEEARIIAADIELSSTPTALAIAPDESRLYVTVPRETSSGELHIIQTSNLSGSDEVVSVGQMPEAIALTPDGKQALVANSGDNTISFITTAIGARSVAATLDHSLNLGAGPCDIAIAPDGSRAYIACRLSGTLTQVDLARRTVIKSVSIGQLPVALALTPSGDKVYTLYPVNTTSAAEGPFLSSTQIGLRLPVDWNLTSGWVTPLCLPEPFHWIALLGLQQPHDLLSNLDASKTLATTLSQVVPTAQRCAYDFNFWGISSEPDALAEVFWLNSECRLIKTDKLFIEAVPIVAAQNSTALTFFRASRSVVERAPLVLHRRRLIAPAGAAQAEIRFTIPTGAVAAIEGISLVATTEEIENPDLTLQSEGRLVGWQLSPGAVPGVSLLASEDGAQFRNAGANTGELVQTIPTGGKKNFSLEWQGQTEVRPSARENPRLELYWLDDKSNRVGEPTVLELSPAGFGTASANGAPPTAATQAELHLVVPAGTTQKVTRLSLRFLSATVVPVTFIAQAPGELTIHDWRVAFEREEAVPPRIPNSGLCQPTPPGQTPGPATADMVDDDSHFCPHCEGNQTIKDNKQVNAGSKRPATLGRCANCGSEVVRFSGRTAANAPLLSISRSPVTRPVLHLSGARSNAALLSNLNPRAVASSQPFAAIKGIGDVRAKQLAAIGIDSIEALSIATPADIAQAKSIPLTLTSNLIAQARELLSSKKTEQ